MYGKIFLAIKVVVIRFNGMKLSRLSLPRLPDQQDFADPGAIFFALGGGLAYIRTFEMCFSGLGGQSGPQSGAV
jgi:hypothetical protein